MLRSRIAPTPSGYLHLGNAFNFILTWLIVRKANGSLRLRIDDLDALRASPEYIEDIFRMLAWLGLDWDEGPQTPQEHDRHFSQRHRMDDYRQLIRQLEQSGHVFACECSRSALAGHTQYPGTCRHKHISFDQPNTALRLTTPEHTIMSFTDDRSGYTSINVYETMRDFIVRRKDGIPAYQLASVCDDVNYGINCIVRGTDLLPSTGAQLYLAQILNLPSFQNARMYHHPLLTDAEGNKLSKSAGSLSLQHLMKTGAAPTLVYEQFAHWMEWDLRPASLHELLERFHV